MSEKRQLLFSVTKDDCDWQTFRAGGPGGQNQNKVSSGVRCIHRKSGAVGESRETRSQLENKRRAFGRMARTKEFQIWHRLEVAKYTGEHARMLQEVERKVDELMDLKFLKIETFDVEKEEA